MWQDALEAYRHALRLGQRESHLLASRGENPYPAVLEEEYPSAAALPTEAAGVMDVPVSRIVGVFSGARQGAFSAGFFPLLGEHTEFAGKWIALYDAHLKKGVRDAAEVYEYLGRYYVYEGNKRISVLKYAGARYIGVNVTRLLPARDGSPEAEKYFAYLAFSRASGLADLYFSKAGHYARLYAALAHAVGEPFTEEERRRLRALIARFRSAYALEMRESDPERFSDAFLVFIEVCGAEAIRNWSIDAIAEGVDRLSGETEAAAGADTLKVSLDPTPSSKAPLLKKLLPGSGELTAAFLYERTAKTSPWTASHEIGRQKLTRHFSGRVRTLVYENVVPGADDFDAISRAVAEGASVLFATTPKMIGACVRAAVAFPQLKILNCSMNMRHPLVRAYYGRLYEAKFIVGAVAGALAKSETIGYLADYPIYGVPASINAFARGAQMTNPRAKIMLEWTCVKDRNPLEAFKSEHVTLISGRDLRSIDAAAQTFGLYRQHGERAEWLALPFWRWGQLYTAIVESILLGTWRSEDAGGSAVNYLWGVKSGVVDVLSSARLPAGTRVMMDVLRGALVSGTLDPLSPFPEPYAEKAEGLPPITPVDALNDSTLAENVVGRIPDISELIDKAKPLVRLQGVLHAEADA